MSSFRKEPTTISTAICDDFDDEDDDCKSHSRSWRDRGDSTKGLESPSGHGQSSFKRVPTMQKLEDMQSICGSSSTDHSYSGNSNRTESTSSANAIRKDSHETSSSNGDNLSSSSYGSDFDSKIERTDNAVRQNNSGNRTGSNIKMMPSTSYQTSRDKDRDGDRSGRNDKISSSSASNSINSYPAIGSGKGNESPKGGNKLPAAHTSASSTAPLFVSPSKSANSSSNSIKVNNLQCAPSMSSTSSSANKTRYGASDFCQFS